MNELKHHGVLGMKWGIRKKADRKVKRYTPGSYKWSTIKERYEDFEIIP